MLNRRSRPAGRLADLPVLREKAYEALLGFGFGGTLLALFMRVGGGIYTKAPTSAPTWWARSKRNIPKTTAQRRHIADNVGDTSRLRRDGGDIFESYEVTIVAAMILGYASFATRASSSPCWCGPSASSQYHQHLPGAGRHKGSVKEAMASINVGFVVVGDRIVGFIIPRLLLLPL